MRRSAGDLLEFLLANHEEGLRRVMTYSLDEFEVLYLREDVEEFVSEDHFSAIAREARFEAIEAPMYEDMYSPAHGPLVSQVKWYANVVELNFVTSESTGVTLALDTNYLQDLSRIVSATREIIENR